MTPKPLERISTTADAIRASVARFALAPKSAEETLAEELRDKPVRECRTAYTCRICHELITPGELYVDGGSVKRVHEKCVALNLK